MVFARELGKPRQEEHDAKLQNLEKEIELLKLRLTALEQETVHDKAEVGQARKLRAVLSEHADDIQTPPAPLHEKVEPVATADNAPVEPHIEPVASPSFSTPVSAEPSVQPEPASVRRQRRNTCPSFRYSRRRTQTRRACPANVV